MLKAAIFDMDGILIDSEPLWQEAEKKVFASLGFHLSTEMCLETIGLRTDEVVSYWYEKRPWTGKPLKQVVAEILDELEKLLNEKGKAMPGVDYILKFFHERRIRLALATSSAFRVIRTVLAKLNLVDAFEVIHSAELEEFGKPDPAIYLSTLRMLGCEPAEAMAFEDSYNGLLSAKAAKIKTVVIPEASAWFDVKFESADLKLKSLLEFNDQHLSVFASGAAKQDYALKAK